MKKILLGLTLFLFVCAVFHKQLLGAAIRFALKWKTDCELAYRSMEWKEGNLIFSDLVMFDPSFHAHVEKVVVQLDWKALPHQCKGHVTIDRPYVSVLKRRELPDMKKGWFDFTATVNEGTVEWEGLAQVSYDDHHLSLDWGHSSAEVTFSEEGIDAELNQFRAALLKSFIPFGDLTAGHLTGRIAIGLDQNLVAANLKTNGVTFALPLAVIEGGEGTISYNSDLGCKWEMHGIGNAQGKQIPFSFNGRGFFKSNWIETEIKFGESSCKINGEESWIVECHQLQSEQLTMLQAGATYFWPEIVDWSIVDGSINGHAVLFLPSWRAEFEGENLKIQKKGAEFSCLNAKGELSHEGGDVRIVGNGYDLKVAGAWSDWSADIQLFSGRYAVHGGWDGEKIPFQIDAGCVSDFYFKGHGWADTKLDLSLYLDGDWTISHGKLPFYCPQISKTGSDWTFDFRLKRATWDLLRLTGTSNGKEIVFDGKSQLLGAPLHFAPCELNLFDVSVKLPWQSILSAQPVLKEWGYDIAKFPVIEETDLHLLYKEGRFQVSAASPSPPFQLDVDQVAEGWKIDLASDLALQCLLQKEGTVKGKGAWKESSEVEFEGKIQPNLHCEFNLPKVHFDMSQIDFYKMEGILDGQGHFTYNGFLESDFDFTASALKINNQPLDNEGSVHLYYSSQKGALLRGVNLHGPFDCIVDLLEYDTNHSHWVFHDAQMHIPGSLLTHRFLQFLDKDYDLNFTADLDFSSDFSNFVCTMREGQIPFDGQSHSIENLHLRWENGKCHSTFYYHDHLVKLNLHIGDTISGRLFLGDDLNPMAIDWEYDQALSVKSIEGSFSGIDASFHADSENSLIGSAHVNFTELSNIVPTDVAEGFAEVKLGKGYECKGRLRFEEGLPYFQGILCGKQIEFFGFQFRTLLAQVDLGPKLMRIYDVKVSDSAGIFKIDEIVLKDESPWTISMPTLTMIDLRPSLLQKPGEPVGPISPLVVRELKATDFKGLLADGSTYTAKGKLHFINSYKREESVFDLPANVLSRIVGLDLELLIPVCGDLTFDLQDGYFHLNELTNAFSEGKRTEFFLVMEPPPTMDLDGNLEIFIKMKQFVLLKITESFLISIDGQLNDPQFHLKKKSFFGFL